MGEQHPADDPPRTHDEFGRLLACARCGHSPDWHRLDSSLNFGPLDPGAKFRCLGGPEFAGCDVDCPDFEGEVYESDTAQTHRMKLEGWNDYLDRQHRAAQDREDDPHA